ncbi:hypothetical protein BDW74DRAFT_183069 [Aspergillus multicolor]|uniref:uncharacterized protein n=1 Tax=Aspergillus multicolor TaxID=41759 RepID=UPI003CCDB8E9
MAPKNSRAKEQKERDARRQYLEETRQRILQQEAEKHARAEERKRQQGQEAAALQLPGRSRSQTQAHHEAETERQKEYRRQLYEERKEYLAAVEASHSQTVPGRLRSQARTQSEALSTNERPRKRGRSDNDEEDEDQQGPSKRQKAPAPTKAAKGAVPVTRRAAPATPYVAMRPTSADASQNAAPNFDPSLFQGMQALYDEVNHRPQPESPVPTPPPVRKSIIKNAPPAGATPRKPTTTRKATTPRKDAATRKPRLFPKTHEPSKGPARKPWRDSLLNEAAAPRKTPAPRGPPTLHRETLERLRSESMRSQTGTSSGLGGFGSNYTSSTRGVGSATYRTSSTGSSTIVPNRRGPSTAATRRMASTIVLRGRAPATSYALTTDDDSKDQYDPESSSDSDSDSDSDEESKATGQFSVRRGTRALNPSRQSEFPYEVSTTEITLDPKSKPPVFQSRKQLTKAAKAKLRRNLKNHDLRNPYGWSTGTNKYLHWLSVPSAEYLAKLMPNLHRPHARKNQRGISRAARDVYVYHFANHYKLRGNGHFEMDWAALVPIVVEARRILKEVLPAHSNPPMCDRCWFTGQACQTNQVDACVECNRNHQPCTITDRTTYVTRHFGGAGLVNHVIRKSKFHREAATADPDQLFVNWEDTRLYPLPPPPRPGTDIILRGRSSERERTRLRVPAPQMPFNRRHQVPDSMLQKYPHLVNAGPWPLPEPFPVETTQWPGESDECFADRCWRWNMIGTWDDEDKKEARRKTKGGNRTAPRSTITWTREEQREYQRVIMKDYERRFKSKGISKPRGRHRRRAEAAGLSTAVTRALEREELLEPESEDEDETQGRRVLKGLVAPRSLGPITRSRARTLATISEDTEMDVDTPTQATTTEWIMERPYEDSDSDSNHPDGNLYDATDMEDNDDDTEDEDMDFEEDETPISPRAPNPPRTRSQTSTASTQILPPAPRTRAQTRPRAPRAPPSEVSLQQLKLKRSAYNLQYKSKVREGSHVPTPSPSRRKPRNPPPSEELLQLRKRRRYERNREYKRQVKAGLRVPVPRPRKFGPGDRETLARLAADREASADPQAPAPAQAQAPAPAFAPTVDTTMTDAPAYGTGYPLYSPYYGYAPADDDARFGQQYYQSQEYNYPDPPALYQTPTQPQPEQPEQPEEPQQPTPKKRKGRKKKAQAEAEEELPLDPSLQQNSYSYR